MFLMVFQEKNQRDEVLKAVRDGKCTLFDGNVKLDFAYAKTQKQQNRNHALTSACKLIENDARGRGKKVEIQWETGTYKGRRAVTVDDVEVFE